MEELVALTEGLPELVIDGGAVMMSDGDMDDRLYILIDGRLVVRRGDEDFVTIDQPGACVGELAVLLGRPHQGAVVAVEPSRVRIIESARAALRAHPEMLHAVAVLLASRLDMVNRYLADVQEQYRDAGGGLGMIPEMLKSLSAHHGPQAEPGSEREPDPLY